MTAVTHGELYLAYRTGMTGETVRHIDLAVQVQIAVIVQETQQGMHKIFVVRCGSGRQNANAGRYCSGTLLRMRRFRRLK